MYIYTMRVDLTGNNKFIADITYVPAEIYAQMPYLKYEGLRIINPSYQRADQHKALAMPFNGSPSEDVFSRWRKDIQRFNLIARYYPVEPPAGVDAASFVTYAEVPVGYTRFVFSGVAAYACLLAFLANAAYSPVMIFLNERYPTAIRSRGTAVSWNTGFMLGGLLPTFVNLLSPTVSDIPGRLVAFIIGAAAVFIVAVAWSPETRGRLDADANAGKRQKV